MSSVLAFVMLTSNFTAYPAFGDRGIAQPPAANKSYRVEATTDLGLVVELVVSCAKGSAIISYSKIEKLYCGPRSGCDRDVAPVIAKACRD